MKNTKRNQLIRATLAQKRDDIDYPVYGEAVEGIERLSRIAKKLDRIHEDDCNGNPIPVVEYRDGKKYEYNIQDEKRAARNEKTEEKLSKEAQAIADKFDFQIYLQTDPRGPAIRLSLVSGYKGIECYGPDNNLLY